MQPGAKKLITARRLLSTKSIVSIVRRYTQYGFIRNGGIFPVSEVFQISTYFLSGAKKLITARRLIFTKSIVSIVRRYTQYGFIGTVLFSSLLDFYRQAGLLVLHFFICIY